MLPSLIIAAATTVPCALPPLEAERQVSLSYSTFDSQSAPYGWRHLNAQGCIGSAISLLDAYATSNLAAMTDAEKMELSFHIGQVLALAGRDEESIAHFERSLQPTASAEWRTYVQATLAFLKRDAAALIAARAAYAAVAPKSMRLKFIDGFLSCPNEPYAKAVHCSP